MSINGASERKTQEKKGTQAGMYLLGWGDENVQRSLQTCRILIRHSTMAEYALTCMYWDRGEDAAGTADADCLEAGKVFESFPDLDAHVPLVATV